ncbi:MAG: sigma 54-interacting transcriptional regulator [Kofleriaceae bacterium]
MTHDLETQPPDPATTTLHAVILVGDDVRHVELPTGGELVIGRGQQADIAIDHPTVSRRHAVLRLTAGPTIRDLGGANGTTVRGRRLPTDAWTDLADGDAVHLGDVVMVLRRQAQPVAALDGRRLFASLEPTLAKVAAGSVSVLILGETGAGKEICAETIHRLSPRSGSTFLRLHCSAMPETLLESELFGHERGAFTGAVAAKLGLIESAAGGTVFLDEVGELPPAVQVKLLRVLDSREVLRLGGLTPRTIDVRFLAATHRDLRAEVEAGRFREDLFYRLTAVTVRVPPLRERKDEIAGLAAEFAAHAARDIGLARPPAFGADALAALARHAWPGNVRELRNVVTRAVLLSDGGPIDRRHLGLDQDQLRARPRATPRDPSLSVTAQMATLDEAAPSTGDVANLGGELRALERDRILATLDQCGGNQTRAARLLGISRGTLIARLTTYGITRPRKP